MLTDYSRTAGKLQSYISNGNIRKKKTWEKENKIMTSWFVEVKAENFQKIWYT
jgi:hypothetical protein